MWSFINKILNKFRHTNNLDENDLKQRISQIRKGVVPNHVAIIMDGNGRWANKRGLPRSAGHQAGVNNLKDIIKIAKEIGIDYITTYAFSTENWKRPKKEVDFLMNLFEKVFAEELDNFNQEGIKVNVMGYKDRLPTSVKEKVTEIMDITKDNTELTINIALDYGGRAEIIEAIKELSTEITNGELKIEEIDEDKISDRLYTGGQPEPDLLIRPGGEERISNFLLWQLAYSELYFHKNYWPEFSEICFLEAIAEYQRRERRFGGLKKSG